MSLLTLYRGFSGAAAGWRRLACLRTVGGALLQSVGWGGAERSRDQLYTPGFSNISKQRQAGVKQHEALRAAEPRDLAPNPRLITLAFDPRHGAGRRAAAAAGCALHLPLPTR